MESRNTIGLLRVYFAIFGLILGTHQLFTQFKPGGGLGLALDLLGVGCAAACLYLALRLKQLVARSPGQMTILLVAAAVCLVLLVLLDLAAGGKGGVLVKAVVALIFIVSASFSVRRLVAEAQSARTLAGQSREPQVRAPGSIDG